MLQVDFYDHAVEVNRGFRSVMAEHFMCSQCGHVFRVIDVFSVVSLYEPATCPSCWCEFIGFDKVTGICTTN